MGDKYFEAKQDKGKLPFRLIPIAALNALAEIYRFGAEKYGVNTWQHVPDAKERYYDALLRHLFAWREGEWTDPESGKPHLWHVLWNAVALVCVVRPEVGDESAKEILKNGKVCSADQVSNGKVLRKRFFKYHGGKYYVSDGMPFEWLEFSAVDFHVYKNFRPC